MRSLAALIVASAAMCASSSSDLEQAAMLQLKSRASVSEPAGNDILDALAEDPRAAAKQFIEASPQVQVATLRSAQRLQRAHVEKHVEKLVELPVELRAQVLVAAARAGRSTELLATQLGSLASLDEAVNRKEDETEKTAKDVEKDVEKTLEETTKGKDSKQANCGSKGKCEPKKHCDPTEACWPSAQVWQEFAAELGDGVLKEIADVSTVYSQCVAAIASYGGATVRETANGTCILGGPCVYEGCEEGGAPNLPVYSVRATKVEHVQAAVNFARTHRVRLSVKSTGASYAVADQQPGSLLVWMSYFQQSSTEGVTENYTDKCGTNHGPVLKIGGGETWGMVFDALATGGKYMMSSGAAVVVGASGGWLQGGGLGPFDRSLGLGIDSVVEFEVVLPDGSLKTASACSEPDLFWALRGGGGGNWGVVVSQTSKVHPIKPLVRANLVWMGAPPIAGQIPAAVPDGTRMCFPFPNSIGAQQDICWTKNGVNGSTLSQWHDVMLGLMNPVTMDHRLDGYYGVGCGWGGGFMCADVYFRGSMAEFEESFLAPLREQLGLTDLQGNAASGPAFAYIASEYRSYYDYASQDCIAAQAGTPEHHVCNEIGYPSANGYNADAQVGQGGYESRLSWMVPASLFENPTRAKALFGHPLMAYITGHVLGGAVNDVDPEATAINPDMRSVALELLIPAELDPHSPSMENVRAMLNEYVPPPSGAPVFNHDALNLNVLTPLGETHGMDWQQMYWGSNLARLRDVKKRYDPEAVFTCRNCLTAV